MEVGAQPLWSRRMELSAATSPELISHQNIRTSADWDSASPSTCTDEMQTDSPSNIKTPVPEGRNGMEVSTFGKPPHCIAFVWWLAWNDGV
jgi:hypothetical protein